MKAFFVAWKSDWVKSDGTGQSAMTICHCCVFFLIKILTIIVPYRSRAVWLDRDIAYDGTPSTVILFPVKEICVAHLFIYYFHFSIVYIEGQICRRPGNQKLHIYLIFGNEKNHRNEQKSVPLFIDYSKAFDKVQHTKLFDVLSSLDSGGKI